jgi:hypothetical protein
MMNMVYNKYDQTIDFLLFADLSELHVLHVQLRNSTHRYISDLDPHHLHPYTIAALNHSSGQQFHAKFNNLFVQLRHQEHTPQQHLLKSSGRRLEAKLKDHIGNLVHEQHQLMVYNHGLG